MKKLIIFFLAIFSFGATFCQKNKPQEPKAPFPYISENVTFQNTKDSVTLSGTITFPEKGNNFPAIILLSGSGPQDRNSNIFGHKPFLVLADYLTKNGIAVLRVDDRGFGESQGNYNTTGVEGFKNDALAGFDFLKTRKDINPNKIGFLGHSLGGLVAQLAAQENKEVAFLVLLAAPGIKGDALMLLQKSAMEQKMGMSETAIEDGQQKIGGAYKIIAENNEDPKNLEDKLKEYLNLAYEGQLPKNYVDALSEQLTFPWLSDLIKSNPAEILKDVKCPVLALNGENDLQVIANENLKGIEVALKDNKNVTIMKMSKLNHLFQESETGLPNEYATIEQTFSTDALEVISKWILEMTKS